MRDCAEEEYCCFGCDVTASATALLHSALSGCWGDPVHSLRLLLCFPPECEC